MEFYKDHHPAWAFGFAFTSSGAEVYFCGWTFGVMRDLEW